MNNTQKIVSNISGYEPHESFTSAKSDDYYDECPSLFERFEHVKEYASNALDIELTVKETLDAVEWLDTSFNGDNDRFHAFKELGQ